MKRRGFGIADEQFIRGDIPMTKAEVRALILAQAGIRVADVIFDIGAGTGSISVEAALAAPNGKVYAIEREPEGVELIRKNAEKFSVSNIIVVQGSAPATIPTDVAADVIIVGGSGGQLNEILDVCRRQLRPDGRLIITAVTVETTSRAISLMEAAGGWQIHAFSAHINRIRRVGASHMFQALNPITLIVCSKEEMNER